MEVYLDNAATTKVSPAAAAAAMEAMTVCYGNPSSTHSVGRAAGKLLASARQDVAAALGAKPEEIYFTGGGTEADNWAVFSASYLGRHRGRHIVSTAVEHDAVLRPLAQLESQGWEVTRLTPDKTGAITAAQVQAALRPDTVLVSVMLCNNETGNIFPLQEIAAAVRQRSPHALVHTDAVQAFTKLPFIPKALGVDLVSISAHKIHGPKGCGALYIRSGLKLPPFQQGGGQEQGRRGGTEGMAQIAAFAAAAMEAKAAMAETSAHIQSLHDLAVHTLQAALPELQILGGGLPHILNLSLPGYRSEVLMNFLDAQGICVSRSSACKKGARSHVLEAMGLPSRVIDGAIRVSFSKYNTPEEVRYFCDALIQAKAQLLPAL